MTAETIINVNLLVYIHTPIAHGEAMELEPMFGVAKRVNTLFIY